jgi:hypothetical protein
VDVEGREKSGEWLRQVQSEKVGRVRIQLSPEVLVEFPVEVFVGHGPGYVTAHMLGISPELEADLSQWLRWWQARVGLGDIDDEEVDDEASEWSHWNQAGDRLCQRLKEELGPGFHVSRT